jgi:hypothetical protein
MKANQKQIIGYKLVFGLLGFSALVTEIATLAARGVFNPANFFSYFTIECNILVCATLLLSAIATAAGKGTRLQTLRAAVTVYILIVGIGFSVLLAGIKDTEFTAVPWDNIVLHYLMPLIMLGDYLLDRPVRQLSFQKSLLWLVFPLAYVLYSLIRGPIAHWYPYAFLDPNHNGFGAVIAVVVGLLVLSLALIYFVTKFSGTKQRQA